MNIDKEKIDHGFYQMPLPEQLEVPNEQRLIIFGKDISSWNRSAQFLFCVCGVFTFYLLYGYYQELIFNIPGFKPFGWYLTLVQFAFYFLFALFETVVILRDTKRRIPLQTFFLIAFLTVATMGMSNASLGYLNYPTQVIFKCCKLIPVLIGGIFIQGKQYKFIDWCACIFMSIGLTFFILADSTIQPKFNYIGVIMMSLALSADAVIGNVQEKAMKSSQASNTEVVLYSYGIGFVYIFIVLSISGMLKDGFVFYSKNPSETYGYTFIFSLTGYLGISFVLTLIKGFGALATVTVTTCRKALTIVLSFLLFAKPFTFQYVWSGGIVLSGIFLNIYSKNKEAIDTKILALFHIVFQKHVSPPGRQNTRFYNV